MTWTEAHPDSAGTRAGVFATTHWSVIVSARDKASPQAEAALEQLCRTYWPPLYAYVRRHGHSPHDAQDLTQEFFARLLQKDYLRAADSEKGRFRTFLLVAFKRFLAHEWERARARKRGGGRPLISLDLETAERRCFPEPAGGETPEQAFDRHWALALLEAVLGRLRLEYAQAGKEELFLGLRESLVGGQSALPYRQLGASLGLSEGAIKVAAHRARVRYRELLREAVGHTLASPGQVEEELRHLLAALTS